MANATASTNLLFHLKAWPRVYRYFKKLKRAALQGLIETVRAFGIGVRFGAPKGFFSGLEMVQQGESEGRIILEGQRLPLLPEPSLIQHASHLQNGRQPWPIFWMKMTNARLVGSSLAPLDAKKRLLLEGAYGEEFCHHDPSYNYLYLPDSVTLSGNWTSVVSLWSEGFYHWFTDALPRLALLHEFPTETKILVDGPLRAYQRESLQMLGLFNRVRESSEIHLVLENYYFSSPPGMTGCTNPYSVKWLREQFLPHQSKIATPKKFFIQRKGKTRGIRNEQEVIDFFGSRDWAVVDLEELTLVEQISWFANADAIVGEHGAAFTNLLWCHPGCHVIELCADNFLNGCYEGISLCNQLRHGFVILKADTSSSIEVSAANLMQLIAEMESKEDKLTL